MIKSSATLTINGHPFKGADLGNEKSIIEIANNVVAQAKALAPVNKQVGVGGQLRNSLMYKTSLKEGGFNIGGGGESAPEKIISQPTKGEGYVGTNLEYSIYQEFGTRYMAPQPFLRPAIAVAANPSKSRQILKKIEAEEMLGALKEGQKRIKFL